MDSLFSVGTRQNFQILDSYNGGTHQIFQKCFLEWIRQVKMLQVSPLLIYCNVSRDEFFQFNKKLISAVFL